MKKTKTKNKHNLEKIHNLSELIIEMEKLKRKHKMFDDPESQEVIAMGIFIFLVAIGIGGCTALCSLCK